MYSLLLVIIYLAFISLGLPDSLIGAGWPAMQLQLGVPISYVGLITMIIAGGTIISSLMSDKLTKKFGVGRVTAISVLLTALALLGFAFSNSFITLCILAIPYGLGAGAVDAALNNYVAINYSSKHMNWLHCSWGVGASISPYIMSLCLSNGWKWGSGYLSVSIIQIMLTFGLLMSLPLWKSNKTENNTEVVHPNTTFKSTLKIRGVMFVLVTFFCYCALESTTGLWTSSYLIKVRNVPIETAASFTSLFYLGISAGRFLCGFVSDKLGDKNMIRIGIVTIIFGITLLILPLTGNTFALMGLLIIGLGCAPVYPAIIHSTPYNFGKKNSQAILGIQMASAYVGSTFIPPLFGLIADKININIFPFYLIIFALLMFLMSELLNKSLKQKLHDA